MHHKATNEFHARNGNHFSLFGFIIFSIKRNFIFVNRNDSGIRDGNTIGIASEIFNGVSVSVEGFFDFGIPVDGIKRIFEFVPAVMISKLLARLRKMQFIL